MKTPRQRILEEIDQMLTMNYRVELISVMRRDRRRHVVKARNAAFWYVWFKYGHTLNQIGSIFQRTHATVLRGIGAHMSRCNLSHPWAQLNERWKETLRLQYLNRKVAV